VSTIPVSFHFALGDLVGVPADHSRIWFVVGRHYHEDSQKSGIYYTLWRADELRLRQAMQEDLLAEASLPGAAALTMPLPRLGELGLPRRVLRALTYRAELTMVWEASILCDRCLLKIRTLGRGSLAQLRQVLPQAGYRDVPPDCGGGGSTSRCWQRVAYLRQTMVATTGAPAPLLLKGR
jgi:hypothetical protein